jgi:hypothetical protein
VTLICAALALTGCGAPSAEPAGAAGEIVVSEMPSLPPPPSASATSVPSATAVQPAPSSTEAEPAAAGTALALLGGLEVKGRAPKTGYARDLFGAAWTDTDRNGCDTRNDMLKRDLTEETFKAGTRECVVLSGQLADPYTGRTLTFSKADASSVQIDHVVALSNAWQTGAQQWPAGKRLAFANDPLNLLAVDGPANGAKSDGDAATWLPPNKAYRCAMVARQTAVKAKYQLWVTAPERDAIARVLSDCPGEVAPTGGNPTMAPVAAPPPAAPPPAASRAPEPAPVASPPDGTDPRFGTCKESKANGYGPYRQGQDREYDWYRDADSDGVVCE